MEKAIIFTGVTISLAVVITVLSIIALATPTWRVIAKTKFGLFKYCWTNRMDVTTCERIETANAPDYVQATRAFMIMGTILAMVEIPLTVLLLHWKLQRANSILAGMIGLAGIFFLIGCSIFTAEQRKISPHEYIIVKFGYSFGLAWTSTILALIAVPFALYSKTRSEYDTFY